jgi:hypothetical protein
VHKYGRNERRCGCLPYELNNELENLSGAIKSLESAKNALEHEAHKLITRNCKKEQEFAEQRKYHKLGGRRKYGVEQKVH